MSHNDPCDNYDGAFDSSGLCGHPFRDGTPCDKPVVGTGWLCKDHGCVKCGHVIAADHEDERLCFDCGGA